MTEVLIITGDENTLEIETSTAETLTLSGEGIQGSPGVGVPVGGTTGQVLKKVSGDDYDTEWDDESGSAAVDSVNGQTGVVVLDQDDIADGATAKQYTATEKTKLSGIATGATANSTDAQLRDRSTHTGSQLASTISDFSTAADARITAQKGQNNGVASLDGSGKVPSAQLPAIALTDVFVVNSQSAQLALTAQEGDVAVRTDQNKSYIHNGGVAGTMGDWQELLTPTDTVLSVNSQTGNVTLGLQEITDSFNETTNPISAAGLTSTNGLKVWPNLTGDDETVLLYGPTIDDRAYIKTTNIDGFKFQEWPNAEGTLAMSVNGEVADESGNIVISIPDVSPYVPYTGAVSPVDLGANNFTVDTSLFHVDTTNDRIGFGIASPTSKYHFISNAPGVTASTAPTIGNSVLLDNTTAATSGNQQYSPGLYFGARGWKTNATAASQAAYFRQYVSTTQGTANPTSNLIYEVNNDGGSWVQALNISQASTTITAATITTQFHSAGITSGLFRAMFTGSANGSNSGITYDTVNRYNTTATGTSANLGLGVFHRFNGGLQQAAGGTGVQAFMSLEPVINHNATVGASSYEALRINVTETSVGSGTNYLARFGVGGTAAFSERFSITAAGNLTGGTYNKVTITAPATSATLTIADGVTLTAPTTTNVLVISGTAKLTVGTTAPSSPAVGDLWVDTN